MATLFGMGPWMIMDVMPTEIVLHDKYLGAVPSVQRVALADLGDLQVELIQPSSGPGTHTEFLQNHGQGIHHMSFGMLDDYDATLAGMKKAGFGIDMQGILAGFLSFTYMNTQEGSGDHRGVYPQNSPCSQRKTERRNLPSQIHSRRLCQPQYEGEERSSNSASWSAM